MSDEDIKDKLIRDIIELDGMTSEIAKFMRDVNLGDLSAGTLLDLKYAHQCLYLAFENSIIEDKLNNLRRGGN